jgi:IS30 family transposase|uniref:hypothetical protein n=1 Tax=[Lactobacillus] rogosae TaxID=706562 RepID=UPI00402A807C
MKQHKKYVCLNYEMRCQLEKMLKAGISKTEISQELDITVHTINYELRKNNMTALTYSAEKAQKYNLLKGKKENV